MFSNKKGMSQEVLVGMILVALALTIYLIFLYNLKSLATSTNEKELCKLSAELNAKRLTILGNDITPGLSDLKCPTKKITVKDPDKIKLILSNQMYDCWDQFGQGKLKFLDPEPNTYCIVCSKISFEGDAKDRKLNGFLNYLVDTRIRDDSNNPVPGVNYTYYRFLTDYETTIGELEKIKSIQSDTIDTGLDYTTVFLYYKQSFWATKLNSIGLLAGSAAIGCASTAIAAPFAPACALVGGGLGLWVGRDHSSEWAARVLVAPYKDIGELGCTALE